MQLLRQRSVSVHRFDHVPPTFQCGTHTHILNIITAILDARTCQPTHTFTGMRSCQPVGALLTTLSTLSDPPILQDIGPSSGSCREGAEADEWRGISTVKAGSDT